jgi:hypothetical protein
MDIASSSDDCESGEYRFGPSGFSTEGLFLLGAPLLGF